MEISAVNFRAVAAQLQRELGNNYPKGRLTLHIDNAKEWLAAGIRAFCQEPQWLFAYDEIAEWMGDSQGKGLCLIGNCGLGKTLICAHILPVIFKQHDRNLHTFTAQEMNTQTEKVMAAPLKVIDDIGIEGAKVDYGDRRMIFSEVVDRVERRGEFLIVTSNLTPDEIKTKYGERTLDRLNSVTRLIAVSGQSMRK